MIYWLMINSFLYLRKVFMDNKFNHDNDKCLATSKFTVAVVINLKHPS